MYRWRLARLAALTAAMIVLGIVGVVSVQEPGLQDDVLGLVFIVGGTIVGGSASLWGESQQRSELKGASEAEQRGPESEIEALRFAAEIIADKDFAMDPAIDRTAILEDLVEFRHHDLAVTLLGVWERDEPTEIDIVIQESRPKKGLEESG